MDKIKYLCRKIDRVEWSGVLLYSVKGSIKNPKRLELYAEDIIPMHKGSSGYTEYYFNQQVEGGKNDDKHIEYISKMCKTNPEVLEWKIGHIHSHHDMGVFFSSTDIDEIQGNSKNHNFYLSLVVNNRMETTAKVATYAKVEHTFDGQFKAKDENGDEYVIEKQPLKFSKDIVKTYDCEVIKPENCVTIDSLFIENVDAIIKEADEKITPKKNTLVGYYPHKNNFSSLFDYRGDVRNLSDMRNRNSLLEMEKNPKETPQKVGNIQEIAESSIKNINFDDEAPSTIEQFAVYILNNGELDEKITVEDFLNEIEDEIAAGSWRYDANIFVQNYPIYYQEFWKDRVENIDSNGQYFIAVIKDIIEVFEEIEAFYDFIEPLTDVLKELLKNFNLKWNKKI